MIWIVPRTKQILSVAKSIVVLTLPILHDVPLNKCKRFIKGMYFQCQDFLMQSGALPYGSQVVNLRRAKSEEFIYPGVAFNASLPQQHFYCEERYFSTNAVNPFSVQLGSDSPYLKDIPLPPLSSPMNFPFTHLPHMQNRYYLRSTDNVSEKIETPTAILKVLSKRTWSNAANSGQDKEGSNKKSFDFFLMSYNVLAQRLLVDHPYLYSKHNPKALHWDVRWRNLFNEIRTMRPDILCLQEVQKSHLHDFYHQLQALGYRSLYKKRTGPCCDGCAIYFKHTKFNLVEYETVEFHQPSVDVLDRDNIAVIAKLSPKQNPKKHFIVATTHLLYNPKRQDVRLAQTQLLLTEVERLSFYRNSKGKDKYCPIIITGDFNATPDSAVYELITKGLLKYDHLAARKMHRPESPRQGNILLPYHLEVTDKCQHAGIINKRKENEDMSRLDEVALIKLYHSDKSHLVRIKSESISKPEMFQSGTLTHLFAFKSVYDHGPTDDPEGTTFQNEWITVDYIFYSGKKRGEQIKDHKLKLLSSFRLPLRSDLGTMTIPNAFLGSDHLSLAAKFRLKC